AESSLRKLSGETGFQAPTIVFTQDNRFRLLFRQQMNTNWLKVATTAWTGAGWSRPEELPYGEGRIDQKIVAARDGANVVIAYPPGHPPNTFYARVFEPFVAPSAELTPPLVSAGNIENKSAPAAPERHLFKGYQLVWGDLHRHTDISEDGGIADGSLLDTMRY